MDSLEMKLIGVMVGRGGGNGMCGNNIYSINLDPPDRVWGGG